MKVIPSIALFSLVSLLYFASAEQTVEEYYCEPMPESYPIMKGNREYLSSDPSVKVCPKFCDPTETKSIWTKFEIKEGGEKRFNKHYEYSAIKCLYVGYGKILG